jgi:hypothetical protein
VAASRPGTGRRIPESPRALASSRPGSSSHKKIELFYLTRPPSSGQQRRLLETPLFAEDVAIQRSRVSSARAERSAVAGDPQTPTCLSSPYRVDTARLHPSLPSAQKSSDPFVNWQEPDDDEVTFTMFRQVPHQPAPPPPPPSSTSSTAALPFSPMAVLNTLRAQRSSLRRPSRLPTPPIPPAIEDLISGGGKRRVSLFPQHPSPKGDDDESSTSPSNDGGQYQELDLADAHTGMQAFQFRSGSPAHDEKPEDVINPDQARKRAFYAKMNDVIAINAGVHLSIPSFPSLPHFQTLHPLDFAQEVNTSELPYSLRVGGYSSNSAAAAATGSGVLHSGGAATDDRGFMSVAQWRREGRASNFVMPSTCNPGPVVASGWTFSARK